MTSLDDFISKKKAVAEFNSKRKKIEGSFQCAECNLYASYAIVDENMSMEWECLDGHMSYGRM
jgi:hypothetical protein